MKSVECHLNYRSHTDKAFVTNSENYASIGKRFHKEFFATDFVLSTNLEKKHNVLFNDQNILDDICVERFWFSDDAMDVEL